MIAEPYLVLFCGGMGGTLVEEALAAALHACALDTLDEALATGAYGGAVVVADGAAARAFDGRLPAGVRLDVDRPGAVFHFGRRLGEVIRRYGLERPVYIGCGLPLIKGDELAAVASVLAAADAAVVSNNFFSADLAGFVPGSAVRDLVLPDNDRILPRFLAQNAGLANRALPRTMANQFDLDTPGDLAVLAWAGGGGPRLTAHMERHPLPAEPLATAARFMTDRDAEVLVSGRVNAQVFQYLATETACRTRVYSEERGMQAAGRDLSGESRTLVGYHLQAVGPRRFFEELATMANAAFIDTRPLFSQMGLQASRPDRFASDALLPEAVSQPWIRELTAAARDAPIPVVLGASTLVNSGIQLLNEAAWRERDRQEAEYRARGRASGA